MERPSLDVLKQADAAHVDVIWNEAHDDGLLIVTARYSRLYAGFTIEVEQPATGKESKGNYLGTARYLYPETYDRQLSAAVNAGIRDLMTPADRLAARLAREEEARLAKEAHERAVAEATHYWIEFNTNWADEFDLRGGKLWTRSEWDTFVAEVKAATYPYEEYFGTNETNTWQSADEVLDDFTIHPITQEQYEVASSFIKDTVGYWPNFEFDGEEEEDEEDE